MSIDSFIFSEILSRIRVASVSTTSTNVSLSIEIVGNNYTEIKWVNMMGMIYALVFFKNQCSFEHRPPRNNFAAPEAL